MTDQQTVAFEPDLYLDIGAVREVKKRSLDAHRSQGPEDIWKAHEAMHRRRGAEMRGRVRRGVQAGRGQSRDARSCPSSSLRKKGERLLPETSQIDRPAPSPRPSVIGTASWLHNVRSRVPGRGDDVRVLVPDQPSAGVRLPVVYVLAGRGLETKAAMETACSKSGGTVACSPFPGPGIMGVRGAGVHRVVAWIGVSSIGTYLSNRAAYSAGVW